MTEHCTREARRGNRKQGTMSSAQLDGGNPFAFWRREMGDQFDSLLQITAKPFANGKTRAFDPATLLD